MRIHISPCRMDNALSVYKKGDVLIINGEEFDFSQLPDDASLPSDAAGSAYIVGSVSRVNGEIELTLLLPHGPNPPKSVAFPEPLLNVPDGKVEFPS